MFRFGVWLIAGDLFDVDACGKANVFIVVFERCQDDGWEQREPFLQCG